MKRSAVQTATSGAAGPAGRRPKSTRTRAAHGFATTRAVISIDSTAIRKKAVAGCVRAQRSYAVAAAEWQRFRAVDEPDYARTVALVAGPLREAMRTLVLRYDELNDWFDAIEKEHLFSGSSAAICLERIEAQRAADERAAAAGENSAGEANTPFDEPDDDTAAWDEAFEHFSGADDPADGENGSASEEELWEEVARRMLGLPPRRRAAVPAAADSRAVRIKTLYRELVRTLHPDAGGSIAPDRLRLWHEVQAAYRAGDLARLEFLHAHSGASAEWQSPVTPVGRLHALTALFKKALSDLRRQIRAAKKEPSWAFSRLSATERKKQMLKIKKLLAREHHELKRQVAILERELAKLRAELERRQARRQENRERRTGTAQRRFEQADLFGEMI